MSKYNRVIHKDGKHLEVDVYDVLEAFDVRCSALQHLVKKALCPGERGHKDEEEDLNDILKSAKRAVSLFADRAGREMLKEEGLRKMAPVFSMSALCSEALTEQIKNSVAFQNKTLSGRIKDQQQDINNVENEFNTAESNTANGINSAIKISSLTKEKQQEIKEAIEKADITGSLNPDFLPEEQDKINEAAKQFEGETP